VKLGFQVLPGACACRRLFLGAILAMGHFGSAPGQDAPSKTATAGACYRVETIVLPEGVDNEVGGIAFLDDGRLAWCNRSGEVWIGDPLRAQWKRFASGLHCPLGILAGERAGEIVVSDRPSLTRLVDVDGDEVADEYLAISEDWGLSGNYHEYTYGPVRDAEGNFVIGLGCASDGAGIFKITRGPVSEWGRQGRMYSPVPWRGWCLKVTPPGKVIPWALGLREPNGFCFDGDGELFATDNQGDWVGTSALHHIRQGAFHGHVASLVWEKGNQEDPLKIPVERLESMRMRPAVLFPHGKAAYSPTQPVLVAKASFGPFAGQLLVGCISLERILRVALEKIGDTYQGAVLYLLDGNGLNRGNNRLAFAPDGSLYVGQTSRGWGNGAGIQRVVFTGETPFEIQRMSLTAEGFELHFTTPVAAEPAAEPSRYSLQRYHYRYHRPYGSPEIDPEPVPVLEAQVSADGRAVSLVLPEVLAQKVYELHLQGIVSQDGRPLGNRAAYYTVNRLR